MDARERLLAMLRGEKTEGIMNEWEPFALIWEPVSQAITPARPGATVKDSWGVTLMWEDGQPGPMPLEGEGYIVCPDITCWRETVKGLDLDQMAFDYGPVLAQKEEAHAQGKLAMAFSPIGLFELIHNLLGFEEALMDFLLEPEAMHELVDYLTEFRMKHFHLIAENVRPDVMLFHDDWGSKANLFMSPKVWREFFKPAFQKLYGYLKSQGIIVMHHADSQLELIAEDMEEIGIDIWQGVLPQCDIPAMQKRLQGKMILMGGIDAAVVDREDVTEAEIRNEVQRVIREYLPGGPFIPCLTYGGAGSIYPWVDDVIQDEISRG